MPLRWPASLGQWLEGLEVHNLTHLSFHSILPEGIPILLVELHSFIVVLGDLDTMLVLDAMLLGLGSKDPGHPDKLLGILSQPPSPLSFWLIHKIIVLGILGKGKLVIFFITFMSSQVSSPVSHKTLTCHCPFLVFL